MRPCYERRQALESFTPRQLRLMFALQPWEKKMNYGEQVGFYYSSNDVLLLRLAETGCLTA